MEGKLKQKTLFRITKYVAISTVAEGLRIESCLQDGVFDQVGKNITEWFSDRVSTEGRTTGRVRELIADATDEEIQAETLKLRNTEMYDIFHGLQHAATLVRSGAVEIPNSGIAIYLTEHKDGEPCVLYVCRNIHEMVTVEVDKVIPGHTWPAGNGILLKTDVK
jgi:hypothetical protein